MQRVVAACAELGIPVVTRGAGTGLSGGANAVDGCVVLDLSKMNRILEIDADNMIAVVQPGVINDDLKAAVAEHGLWYPPDPASAPWSTIGGNVATNAGGLCCLKYGVTRDYVLGLEAVVGGPAGAYGTAVRLGRRTTKGVSGYDLVGVFVGSEGTLGVVTEVTLRLRPARKEAPRTVVGAFGSVVAAGAAVAESTRRGLLPAALELMDRSTLQAVEDWKHLGLAADAEALLLAQIDTPGAAGADEAAAMAEAFTSAGALWAEQSTDEFEAEALFSARRLAYPALERLGPVLTEDVCVPRSKVPDMLQAIEEIAARHGVTIATVAHAGDGNLHPLILSPAGDDAARDGRAGRVRADAGGGDRAGRHGHRRARRRPAETRRDAAGDVRPRCWPCSRRSSGPSTRSTCSTRARSSATRRRRSHPCCHSYAITTDAKYAAVMSVEAMHIANGIVNGPVSAVFAVISLAALAFCVLRSRADLDDRLAPMAGLVAAFIFAVQMLNFQVLPGVSGHLLGGALAAMLVGPWVGALCVATVLIVQCLLFADGGLTALGLNITNMALLGTAAGYLLIAGLLRVLPKTASGVATTAFIASVVSVVVASQGFVLEYCAGRHHRSCRWPPSRGTMAGVHTLIGIGEGLIAATTVATVAKVRPDLVYALRRFRKPRPPARRRWECPHDAGDSAGSSPAACWWPLLLAGVVSNFASSSPDGLDATALRAAPSTTEGEITGGTCMAQQEQEHQTGGQPARRLRHPGHRQPVPVDRAVRRPRRAGHVRRSAAGCSGWSARAGTPTASGR